MHCGSNNNPSNAVKSVVKVKDTLIFHPSSTSSTSSFIRCNGETMDCVPDIVRIGREAQCGVNAAVVACGMKMLSVVWYGRVVLEV